MATATKPTGTRIQTWVPLDLAAELKQHAERERRSIGAVIRLAIEDTLVGVPSSRVTARPRRLATLDRAARRKPSPAGVEVTAVRVQAGLGPSVVRVISKATSRSA
jgi:Ribbon-helix-helix protein, copG family